MRLQHVGDTLHLQAYHVGNLLLRELLEGDNFVDTVQELRSHDCMQLFACSVRGHDDDGVLEVRCTSLVVRQSAVIEHLQEYVEDVRVRLLNLIEQQHLIRLATHSLRQLAALIVSDVTRRCANQTADGMLLLILTHIDTRHHLFVVEQVLGQCLCQLRLTHTRSAEEDE